jgi:hypothetical protein
VQVELGLHDPVTAPELAHDFVADAGPAVKERLVGIEQHFGIEFVGDRLGQHGTLVAPRLHRHGRRRRPLVHCARRSLQRRYAADFAPEKFGVGRGLPGRFGGGGALAFALGRAAF